MECIGRRVKSRSKKRIHEVNKRKKMESPVIAPVKKRRRRRRRKFTYHNSDIEDITPIPSQPTVKYSSGSRIGSQNVSVKESLSRVIKDLNVDKVGASSSKLRRGLEQNKRSFRVPDLAVEKNVFPSSYGLRDESEPSTHVKKPVLSSYGSRDESEPVKKRSLENVKKKPVPSSPKTRGVAVEKSLPGSVIEIHSESESENAVKVSAKKKLFRNRVVESSDEEDEESETESDEEETEESEDDIMVNSLSSSSASLMLSSSSSSDDDFNLTEVVGETNDENLRPVSPPPVKRKRGRPKKTDSVLTKKVQTLNRREQNEEEEPQKEAETVMKQPSNVVFTCCHCGKENTGVPESLSSGIRPQELRDEFDDVNNVASTSPPERVREVQVPEKTSRPEVQSLERVREVQVPEKTSRPEVQSLREVQVSEKTSRPEVQSLREVQVSEKTSRPEVQSLEKAKQDQTLKIPEVAEGLNETDVANEPIDDEFDPSLSFFGDESETSLQDKEVKTNDNNNSDWKMINGNNKEDLLRLLINCVRDQSQLGEEEEVFEKDQTQEQEDLRKYDDDGLLIIRPPPLVLRFGVVEPPSPPEMTEWEREEQMLWEEAAFGLKSSEDSNELLPNIDEETVTDENFAARCKKGNHELELDIEIGLKCIHCGFVDTEIRFMDPEWAEKVTSGRRRIDRYEQEDNNSFVEKFVFKAPNNTYEGCGSTEGTVWETIPGVKSQMYPHQQEGFEFIWRNLAGTIMLKELKEFENSDETGGCIMSHAPGTGKTRLTIIFLQAYLECFPNCKPVIIAPASILLTWAEEFKKWNISVPFHNLSSLDISGKESAAAMNPLMQKNSSARSKNDIRIVKLFSWIKSKSILGISYNLYEKLAGVKEVKLEKELGIIREILIGVPGLLVLDEAHIPRNQRSRIWKTLTKVETQKRILLSGTPFQNNFQELCNVLGLARPKYVEKLTSTLKKSGMTTQRTGDGINNRGIEELKTVMLPFVHVHKGSILQKSLPGLRECVVVLNPPELQKRVLESIEVAYNSKTNNVFETEHKLSLVSVHPSLISCCTLSKREKLSIDEALLAQLRKIKLDPNQSVKTRFLMEFIGYCEIMKEKVLVFSQYIDPLELIRKHLVSRFKWNEGEEVLYMHGKLEQTQRQLLINEFNDPRSKAKVLLASTKACSEGINLIGASRVILLDVVWNPAVERQAISRAYRIGQKRIVYTYHLVAKGTPEGPKYCKQAKKDRISELVFASSSRHEKGKEKIEKIAEIEDKVLDTMVKHSKLRDMFDNLIVQPKEADLVEGFNMLMP